MRGHRGRTLASLGLGLRKSLLERGVSSPRFEGRHASQFFDLFLRTLFGHFNCSESEDRSFDYSKRDFDPFRVEHAVGSSDEFLGFFNVARVGVRCVQHRGHGTILVVVRTVSVSLGFPFVSSRQFNGIPNHVVWLRFVALLCVSNRDARGSRAVRATSRVERRLLCRQRVFARYAQSDESESEDESEEESSMTVGFEHLNMVFSSV